MAVLPGAVSRRAMRETLGRWAPLASCVESGWRGLGRRSWAVGPGCLLGQLFCVRMLSSAKASSCLSTRARADLSVGVRAGPGPDAVRAGEL